MRYREFIRKVEGRVAGGLTPRRAERATHAVLRTLAQCLPDRQADQLAAQLPNELKAALRRRSAGGPPRTLNEFLDLVAERERLGRSEAFDHSHAVLNVLGEAVTGHELARVRLDLPDDLRALFEPPAAANWPETHAPRIRN